MASEQNQDIEMKEAEVKSEKEPTEESVDPAKAQKDKDLLTYEGLRLLVHL